METRRSDGWMDLVTWIDGVPPGVVARRMTRHLTTRFSAHHRLCERRLRRRLAVLEDRARFTTTARAGDLLRERRGARLPRRATKAESINLAEALVTTLGQRPARVRHMLVNICI